MNKNLILVGGGGHCRSVIDVAERLGYTITGILDRPSEVGKYVMGYRVVGTDDEMRQYVAKSEFIVTVGHTHDASLRRKLHSLVVEAGGRLATLVSPFAQVSRHATVGEGSVIMNNAHVNAMAAIGMGGIINSCCNIEHDVEVGDFSHVSTGAMVNGGCRIGSGVFVGSGAVLINGCSVTDECIIGAGAVVVRDIAEKGIYAGVPARLIKGL